MNDIEKFKCLLIDFEKEFEEYGQDDGRKRRGSQTKPPEEGFHQVIEIAFDCTYGAKFIFDKTGKFLDCDLAT